MDCNHIYNRPSRQHLEEWLIAWLETVDQPSLHVTLTTTEGFWGVTQVTVPAPQEDTK